MPRNTTSFREDIFDYVKKEYKTTPEYLWKKFPSYAVLRNNSNRKWYGVVMNLPKEKLGLNNPEEFVDVLNIKCDPLGVTQLVEEGNGFLKAYHMTKKSWVSVLLDGSVELDRIKNLLSMSYELVERRSKK